MNVDSGKHIGMEYDIHLFTNISLQAESSRLIELIVNNGYGLMVSSFLMIPK